MSNASLLIQDRYMRLSEVKAITGLSRSNIYLNISKGNFPKQKKISVRSVGWLASEIEQWRNTR